MTIKSEIDRLVQHPDAGSHFARLGSEGVVGHRLVRPEDGALDLEAARTQLASYYKSEPELDWAVKTTMFDIAVLLVPARAAQPSTIEPLLMSVLENHVSTALRERVRPEWETLSRVIGTADPAGIRYAVLGRYPMQDGSVAAILDGVSAALKATGSAVPTPFTASLVIVRKKRPP